MTAAQLLNYRGPAGFANSGAKAAGLGECEVTPQTVSAKYETGEESLFAVA
jgi:hypothetical protein